MTTNAGLAVCNGCRVFKDDGSRLLKLKVCRQCKREYRTRGGNALCASCIHQSKKHPCAKCGVECDKRATHCRKCAPRPLVNNGKVKAHRVRGYVRVKAPSGHPRAHQKYIPEHTAIMESLIGRYLLPGENVHHKNGVRHDNRPENLELWAKAQPSGQRAIDLLEWAREIIARYEPIEASIRDSDFAA